MKAKKLWFVTLTLITIPCLIATFHYAKLCLKYNYKAESVADFGYTMQNPPPHVFSKQGVEYLELRNGITVRLDQVYSSDNTLSESVAYGIPNKYGTYYIHREGLCLFKETGKTSRYKLEKNGQLLPETRESGTEIYYLNISGKRFICVSSTDGYATDNSMLPSVTLEKNGLFITYLTPSDLNRNYEITVGSNCITGDYLSGEISRRGGGSWY